MDAGKVAQVVLWSFILALGTTFGAGLYESRVVVPKWTRSAEGAPLWDAQAALRDDPGRKFWGFVSTVPLTLLTIASLILAWRATGELRTWWLAAAAVALADRIFTFSYFIPTMVRLMRAVNSAEARAAATRWANLDYLRHAIVLVAWLLALKAFAVMSSQHR